MNPYYKLIKGEEILVKIKTKSDIGFWQYQLLGLLSLFTERANNYLVVTDKRILVTVKDIVKLNEVYHNFSEITFNSKNDTITFTDSNFKTRKITLTDFQLEYDDYQYLKHQLNQKNNLKHN